MIDQNDILELADELAEIARTTSDAGTGMRLMKIVSRLFVEAGLPRPGHEPGGGDPPTGWLCEPVCCAI
jgi:hypothetical protein